MSFLYFCSVLLVVASGTEIHPPHLFHLLAPPGTSTTLNARDSATDTLRCVKSAPLCPFTSVCVEEKPLSCYIHMGPFHTLPHSTAYSHVIIMFASFQIESPFAALQYAIRYSTLPILFIQEGRVSKIHRQVYLRRKKWTQSLDYALMYLITRRRNGKAKPFRQRTTTDLNLNCGNAVAMLWQCCFFASIRCLLSHEVHVVPRTDSTRSVLEAPITRCGFTAYLPRRSMLRPSQTGLVVQCRGICLFICLYTFIVLRMQCSVRRHAYNTNNGRGQRCCLFVYVCVCVCRCVF